MKKPNYFLITITLLLSPIVSYACDKDQAFNKMMALNRYGQELLNAGEADSRNDELRFTTADFMTELTAVGSVLAEEKYADACQMYDAIARKYNVDLKEKSKDLITMDQIKKDGGRMGGACSQSDASMKIMNYTKLIENKSALEEISSDSMRSFLVEISSHNDLMYTNPSLYCAKVDEIAKRYKLD